MSIKPQYLLPLAFFFLVKQQYKVILGLVCGCVVLLLISIILVGFAGLLEYIHFLLTTLNQWDSYTIHPTSMFTLESLLLNLTHSTSISSVRTLWYCLCLGVLMLFSLATWRRTKRETSSDLEWTLLIVTMILISPYTNIQDLSLLTAAGVFVARWIRITQRTTAKKILIGIICSGYILGQMIGVIWLLHNVTGYIMLLLCFYGVLCFILIQENYPGLQRHLLLMKKQLGSKK